MFCDEAAHLRACLPSELIGRIEHFGSTAVPGLAAKPIIDVLASRTAAFGGPVLLFTGDSHVYRSDDPLVQNAPCTGDSGVCSYDAWQCHPYYDVPNLHRVVVHGSTFPLEWLKLTVDPAAHAPSSAFRRWRRSGPVCSPSPPSPGTTSSNRSAPQDWRP